MIYFLYLELYRTFIMFFPKTLVLAKNYSPISIFPKLSVIDGEEAINKYMNGKCEVIHFYDRPVLSKNVPIELPNLGMLFWPSVIVDFKQKIRDSVRLSISTLYYREGGRCFWCDQPIDQSEATKDHLIPVSKGGENTFENLVCACKSCNTDKADLMPTGKWKPKRSVRRPTYHEIIELRRNSEIIIHDQAWADFLPNFSHHKLYGKKNEKTTST